MSARASWIFLCFLLWDSPGVIYANRRNDSGPLAEKEGDYSSKEILELLIFNSSYNAGIPPVYILGEATTIYVQVYVVSIDITSAQSQDYSINLHLRQQWVDPRLDFTNYSKAEMLELDFRVLPQIWIPDTYFVNTKDGRFHTITAPNRMMFLFRDGAITYSLRLSLLLPCHMRLQNYPLDTQTCPIKIASFAYTVEDIVYQWIKDTPVRYDENLQTAQFRLVDHTLRDCTMSYVEIGTFSCIEADFKLERDFGFYIIQVYVPSILIVILSWVSFWLDVEAIPARITLGVLSVLTMTTQSSGIQSSLPRVGYVKAIDVWMASCLFFVFAALLEFAYINVLIRREDPYQSFESLPETKISLNNGEDVYIKFDKNYRSKKAKGFSCFGLEGARDIDRLARFILPAAFLLFNMIYWTVYLYEDIG